MKKEIDFTCSKSEPTIEESLAISHALAEIVNRTFAHQELVCTGTNWAKPQNIFRTAPVVQPQGWQLNSL